MSPETQRQVARILAAGAIAELPLVEGTPARALEREET